MENQTLLFKNNGGFELNDVMMPLPAFELPNYAYKLAISPKTKFWRMGLRFSRTSDIELNSSGRYNNMQQKDLQIAAGRMSSKNLWNAPNIVEIGSYYMVEKGNNPVFGLWDNYDGQNPIEFSIKHGAKLNTLHFSCTTKGLPKIENETFFPLEYRYFKIFAWSDYNSFEVTCEIEIIKQPALALIDDNQITKNKKLDLSKCGIHEIPSSVAKLEWLEELVIGTGSYFDYSNKKYIRSVNIGQENVFQYIPPELSRLTKLKVLIIQAGKSRVIKMDLNAIAQLYQLQFLCIVSAGLTDITPLQNLKKLEQLYLYDNNISSIQPLSALSNLKTLRFRGNKVSDISALSALSQLQVLRLGRNQVRDISALAKLDQLSNLSFYSNLVTDISAVAYLKNLVKLTCRDNKISSISAAGHLQLLESFDFTFNNVEDITVLGGLTNLKTLIFGGNKVSNLSALANLSALQELLFRDNKITDLHFLENLPELTELDCSSNKIEHIEAIGNLKKLRKLNIKKNPVSEIDSLKTLVELKEIDISHTKIADISPLTVLKKLEKVDLESSTIKKIRPLLSLPALIKFYSSHCPINDCPADVHETGDPKQLRAFFETKKTTPKKATIAAKEKKHVRLMILGNSNTGKTNLVHYLETGQFLGERKSTHGLEVHTWDPDPKRFPLLTDITVSIWDFGGQEYYHEAYKLFLKNNAVYLVLWCANYDLNGYVDTPINGSGSSNNLEHFDIRYWLDVIHYYTRKWKGVSLFATQNKIDGETKRKRIDQTIHDRYFINDSFHISLKEGSNPANTVDHSRLQYFLKELENEIFLRADKESTPAKWNKIKIWLSNIHSPKNPLKKHIKAELYIGLDEFKSVCHQMLNWQLTADEVYTIPRWLNNGGVVLYFPDSPDVKDNLFIPDLLALRIYDVLNLDVLKKKGEFSKDDITGVSDPSAKDLLLYAAAELGIIFPHPVKGKDNYIAFQYLPDTHQVEDLFRIAEKGISKSSFKIKIPLFYYKRVLYAVLLHFAANPSIERKYFWKHGILFVKDQQVALIQGIHQENAEKDMVILLGIEAKEYMGNLLYKEIFKVFLDKLILGPGENKIPEPAVDANENDDRENEIFEKSSNMLAQHEILLSDDGINYVSYEDLLKNKGEAKIRANTGAMLFTKQFEPLLEFTTARAKKVFLSYSHRDTKWLDRLKVHLAGLRLTGIIESWDDKEINAGEIWENSISKNISEADVYILLLSADFLASKYIWEKEVTAAINNYKYRGAIILPILFEPFDLTGIPGIVFSSDEAGKKLGDFEIIPKTTEGHLMAVSRWINIEEAMEKVTIRIREVLTAG